MGIFAVSYDLRAPGRDYQSLYNALGRYQHCHMMESFWLLDTPKSASNIRDDLSQHIDQNDQLFVGELKRHWAAAKKDKCTEWLKNRSW
jgi:hypothetical protein